MSSPPPQGGNLILVYSFSEITLNKVSTPGGPGGGGIDIKQSEIGLQQFGHSPDKY